MIVLGLVARGFTYGLAIEEFAARTHMRRWAQIGLSTIYKVLKDLEREKFLTVRPGEAKRGPGKNVYRLTAKGRKLFLQEIAAALTSEAPVISDRITGLSFAVGLEPEVVAPLVEEGRQEAAARIQALKQEKGQQRGQPVANIVLDYQIKVLEAERDAFDAIESILKAGGLQKLLKQIEP